MRIRTKTLNVTSRYFLGLLPIALWICGCLCGYGTEGLSKKVMYHSQRYKEETKYEDLVWLANSYLQKGLSRNEVREVLGTNFDRVGAREAPVIYEEDDMRVESVTWRYSSEREIPSGAILYIHFSGPGKHEAVLEWEWASE